MVDLTPVVRLEYYLDAIVNDGTVSFYPVTRLEMMLDDILNGRTVALTPITRVEMYLANIGGQNIAIPVPITRIEMYLAKIAGMEIEVPDPITRIEMWLAEWAEHGGGGGTITTITGVSPLALVNAVAGAISRLVQKGKAVQNGTPTPSAPVDIVCNNGAVRMVDAELPAGYKRVLGFTLNNNSYWEIEDFPLYGSDTLRFSFEATDACNVIGAYSGSASGNNYSLYVSSSSNYLRYKNEAYNSTVVFNTRYDVEITPTGSHGMKVSSTWTEQTFATPTNLCIGSTAKSTSSAKLKGNLYGNIEVVGRAKFVPCERVSDNVLGYYDLIGEAFHEQASSFDGAVSLGYDGSHYELRVVGTDEVLSVTAADAAAQTATVPMILSVGNYADEVEIISGGVKHKVGIKVFDGTEELAAHSVAGTYRYRIEDKKVEKSPFTSTHFVYSSKASSDISYGEMMCGAASANAYFRNTDCATLADFTAWLAAQYAAGTPVIVIYPLAYETTESVTPQPLSTAEGTNTVNVVSDVAPVELEVDYLANA